MPVENPASNAEEYANRVPEAIRRQSKRVDAMAREVGMANAPPEETPPAPVEQPVAVVPPVADPPPVVTPAPVADPPTDWEQRYRTLQGKYDAEIPGLRTQVSSLERVIAAVQPREPAPVARPTTVVEVPPEDIAEYGEDLVKKTRAWARAELQHEMNAHKAEVAELKAKLGTIETSQIQSVEHTAKQTVFDGMDKDPLLGSTWRVTNEAPAFLNWLQQPDPMSGQQRQQMLTSAFLGGSYPRVAAFFKAYAQEHTAPQVPVTPAHTPQPGTGGPSLEDLAAPGRGTGPTQSGAPADKRIWTSNSIAAFYRDVQRGVFAGTGREAERLRLEQDIFTAAAEGRVR
jgi:hypothetical protein